MIEYYHSDNAWAYKAWLDSLQPGDTWACVYYRGYTSRREIVKITVERLTKTQIVTTSGTRYRREDGKRVAGSSFNRLKGPARQEEIDQVAEERRLRQMLVDVESFNWRGISKEKLEAVLKIIKED